MTLYRSKKYVHLCISLFCSSLRLYCFFCHNTSDQGSVYSLCWVLRYKKLQGTAADIKYHSDPRFSAFLFFFFLPPFCFPLPFHPSTFSPSDLYPTPFLLSLFSHSFHNAFIHQSRLFRRCRRRSLGHLGSFLRPSSGGCHLL